jgi:biotin carboxyl carrier protein
MKTVFILSLIFVCFVRTSAQNTSDKQPPTNEPKQPKTYMDVPVKIEAPIEPTPVKGDDGKWYLVYHLFLTNWAFDDLILDSVEAFDASSKKVLARYDEKDLTNLFKLRSILPTPSPLKISSYADLRRIASGRTAALFFWIPLEKEKSIPATIKHRFVFAPNPLVKLLSRPTLKPEEEISLEAAQVSVRREQPVVLGAPLRGGNWRCLGVGFDTPHQYLETLDGKTTIAQRFAVDFSKVDDNGDVLPSPFPDDINNEMFYGYGAEILAVADGVIAYVKEGVPENKPLISGQTNPPQPLTRETFPGNQISINLGGDRYAWYAHLQPGSILVKVGDKVRKGQVIARLGDSGNAAGPHLHFHVSNANDLNASEGLPFVFESFGLVWRLNESKKKPASHEIQKHKLEIPLNNSVIYFDELRHK